MILHQTPYLTIEFQEDILFVTWRGFTESNAFREGIQNVFKCMEEHQITKKLTDISEHQSVSMEDQEYATQVSLDFSKKTDLKVKRALITPKNVFARFAVRNVNNNVQKFEEQERKMFDNQEEALHWLKSA